ncbi:MAG TPA: choice-of-anchor D domain-containing protein [Terracidiphilus sp.]|nr:choice-of-anchor D domain-containing protein [Terracidiphilus sp.]
MFPLRSLSLAFAAGALILSQGLTAAQEAAPQVRIVQRIDESNLVTLRGNTHPLASARYDRGRVSPDLPMDGLILVLERSPEQQAAFDKFVASQADSNSPNYHKWLEPEEVGERFGPSMADINTVEGWLRGHGFTVDELSKDRMTIRFSGTSAQVEETFHTEIHNLDVNGVKHFANMSDPRIPAALAPVVAGPKALHNFRPHPLHKMGSRVILNKETSHWEKIAAGPVELGKRPPTVARPQFGINDQSSGNLIEDVAPYDFAAMYNVLPEWNKGIDGAGVKIAVAGTSEISSGDVNNFRTAFGLPALKSGQFTQVVANNIDPGQCGTTPTTYCNIGDQVENSLDVEWSGAVAKGANVVLVVSGENSTGSIDTVFDSAQYVVNHNTAPILNVSYGLCELGEGTAGNKTYNNLWQSASAEGIAVFVAAGDSGSASCDEGGDQGGQNLPYAAEYGLSVSGIASTPFNVAVGGTDLLWCDPVSSNDSCASEAAKYWNTSNAGNKSNAKGYIAEIPWNSTCVNKIAIEYVQSVASQLGDVDGTNYNVGDAEQACNFSADPNVEQELSYYGGPDLTGFVDTTGAGGGESNCINGDGQNPSSCTTGYTKPSWQTGVSGIRSDNRRQLPDLSSFASNGFLGSALLICETPGNAACTYSATSEDVAQEIGGTSGSSPAMAGVMALIEQKSGNKWGGVAVNTELYALAAKQNSTLAGGGCSAESVKTSSTCYFNDVDTGSIIQACDHGALGGNSPNCQVLHSGDKIGTLQGYAAGHGYDMAAGLGSPNVANIVNAWPAPTGPAVSLSATTLAFGAVATGSKSTPRGLTLKNTGHAALTLNGTGQGIKITGTNPLSFVETNNCGSSVAAGASCLILVTFKPMLAGNLKASLTVTDNATGSPQSIALSGTGAAPAAKLSTPELKFPVTAVGKSSTRQVMLTNSGKVALSLSGTGRGFSIKGTNSLSFTQKNNCGTSLAAGKSCTITVTFAPRLAGPLSAALWIADNASGSPQKVALRGSAGSGAKVSLSNQGLRFDPAIDQ